MKKNTTVVSNKDETIPLFENPWLEKLTHIHPAIPLVIYLPVIAYFLYLTAAQGRLDIATAGTCFVAGAFAWTLVEYLFHRFIFHYQPTSAWGKYLHFLMHGIHHDYPRDSKRLVMAPVVSIPLAILFYGLFILLLPAAAVAPTFAGLIFGYLCYDMIHYATHHFPMRGRVGLWLKHHHMLHHYQDNTFGYGVSSPFWDWIFRTSFPPKEAEERAETPKTALNAN